jgi:hypothetical protein
MIFLGGPLSAGGSSVREITPNSVERMLATYGARQTIKILTNAGPNREEFGDFDKVLAGVGSGNRQWLVLVPKLEQGTDAAAAESLFIAVARALPKNPAGVLRLITAHPSWRDACTFPMIEPSARETQKYFNTAIPAVKSVREPALQPAKKRCLAKLVKAQHAT